MAERKQVMDIHANSSGITQAESNEQQRNWNDKMWSVKASDSISNYDPTRKHLNFEVAKCGIIQPIDTSKSIAQKMAESLASRGIKDPNDRPNVRRKQNTLAQFVFGGSRERMLNLAFGSQKVSLEKERTTLICAGLRTLRVGQRTFMILWRNVLAKTTL